jgi:hypothetical protein
MKGCRTRRDGFCDVGCAISRKRVGGSGFCVAVHETWATDLSREPLLGGL